MSESLAGKWVWVWNWRRCDGGDPQRVAERLKAAGCRGRAGEGVRWRRTGSTRGCPSATSARGLKARGVAAGGWGYLLRRDPAGEAQTAIETAQYGEADLLVLDVESEFKGHPEAAEEIVPAHPRGAGAGLPAVLQQLRHRALPPLVPVRGSSAATARAPRRRSTGTPSAGRSSSRWAGRTRTTRRCGIPPSRGLPRRRALPGGRSSATRTPDEVRDFIARRRGARVARRQLLVVRAHGRGDVAGRRRRAPRSSRRRRTRCRAQEYGSVSRALADSRRASRATGSGRAALRGGVAAPAGAAAGRTPCVAGDTLSGIAAKLGLGDWQRLYEANAGVIGGDPNRIYPGQVLVLP